MTNQIVWQERFLTGIENIDKEHKKLFSIIHKLIEVSSHDAKWACQEAIKYFNSYTIRHMADEEAYMQSISYKGYDVHKHLHDNFRYKILPALKKELESTEYSKVSVRHFLGVCTGWLTAHIATEDLAVVGKGISKWAGLPSEEVLNALKQTTIQLIHNLFRLDAHAVSESYSGEDFGNSVCMSFIYRSQKDEKWEILLVFEEQLLIRSVNEITGSSFRTVNDLVLNTARFLARQFLEQIWEAFSSEDEYTLEHEQLLTRKQLLAKFEQENPQYSILFDTGAGYFASCYVPPQSLCEKEEPSINEENVLDKVKEYLMENGVKKKRILVADDSSVIRSSMKKLLEQDYIITEANSGLSVLQSIFKNRPDLILLDYEMPVCDGRQTLEMIRAEEGVADIPVIFLTGRGDKESILKVLSLKPADYLLKSMKPADIKRNIDRFFQNQEQLI